MRPLVLSLGIALLLSAPALAVETTEAAPKPLPPGVVELSLEELHCATCAKKVARKLYAVPGVKRVKTDLEHKRFVVTLTPKPGKPTPVLALWKAVVAGEQKPLKLRYEDQELTPKTIEAIEAASRTRGILTY
ncbi:Heavy-metal-associated domain protein [Pseudobythopirellula maris]|uniref:Heavy-metal-associated domain protein n=1 Tax=Pseudobythopirellula maris TaxID=2527991 RepID=A0A5C5ZNT6_9BACT|nr:heavy metal-associated domain-containing protein [Pseudobythopirellula maris]TWT88848.1 Heavy-metal-associated domain protein [Pseudobythopirellula maris]